MDDFCTLNEEVVKATSQLRLSQSGKCCCITILGTLQDNLENVSDLRDINLLTLKSGYRPSWVLYSQAVSIGTNLWGPKTPQFTSITNGGVLGFKKGVAGQRFAVNFTYICS